MIGTQSVVAFSKNLKFPVLQPHNHRRAVSSEEPSLDGSMDEEQGALSDSDLARIARTQTLATQAKGPSSDALESECRAEQSYLDVFDNSSLSDEWIDVVGTGQLLCKVESKGNGPKPRNGQRVKIRVTDQKLGIDSVEVQTFVLGFSMVIDAWELVIQLMHEGEIDYLKTDHRFAYGSIGEPSRGIPPYQSMEYILELIEIIDLPIFSQTPRDDLILFLSELKERGNYYYGRREFDKAVYVYKRGTDLINIPEDDDILCGLMSVLYSNLAVCYAKVTFPFLLDTFFIASMLCDWDMTLDASNKALQLNPENTKALFRKANAFANLNLIEEAITTLRSAINIDPEDQFIRKELNRLKVRFRLYQEQERSLCKRMISGRCLENETKFRAHGTRLRYVLLTIFFIFFGLFIHFLLVSVFFTR
ncbi:unnamed protein product [Dracunculus medinensis]|uniref:peptidylprolyl isomerase n=1 Tax=Dracunculus medinensis TaxID=318479 RepID=A0A0N4UQ99_DRAME|nr:unnamed protein product [Dracunculus medinensis]